MHLIDKRKSKIDNTVKYAFMIEGQPVEFSYINKGDGKDIICTPTQTNCKMGCTFCHLTGRSAPVINLGPTQIFDGIRYIIGDLDLPKSDTLLVSFMGAGEPLNNISNVIVAMILLSSDLFRHSYNTVRFAVASIIPSLKQMQEFTSAVDLHMLPVKFHLSLHETGESTREELMPQAALIESSINIVENYSIKTGNPVEIHYTLIADVNDSDANVSRLAMLLRGRNIPIKFLAFKPKADGLQPTSPERVAVIREYLEHYGDVRTEFYDPPGGDIGASCGQFLQQLTLGSSDQSQLQDIRLPSKENENEESV